MKGKKEWVKMFLLVRGRSFSVGFSGSLMRILDSLHVASGGKDVDDKEVRALRSVLLKLLRIWDKALLEGQRDPRLGEMLQRVEKQVSLTKSGEG